MNSPFGGFGEEALAAYQAALAEKEGLDFSEGGTYDFTTCIRPDGSPYGTAGTCRKGTEGEAKAKEAKSSSGVPVLTKDDMKKMSESELRGVKKQMDERAFGKGSAPLSNEKLQAMSEQSKAINEELKSRVTATPGMAARVKAAKEKLKA